MYVANGTCLWAMCDIVHAVNLRAPFKWQGFKEGPYQDRPPLCPFRL